MGCSAGRRVRKTLQLLPCKCIRSESNCCISVQIYYDKDNADLCVCVWWEKIQTDRHAAFESICAPPKWFGLLPRHLTAWRSLSSAVLRLNYMSMNLLRQLQTLLHLKCLILLILC